MVVCILLPTIKATFFISHQNYFWLCFKICISIARWHLVHKINCLFILEKKEHTRISKYDVVQLIFHCWKKKFRRGDMRSNIKIFRSICRLFQFDQNQINSSIWSIPSTEIWSGKSKYYVWWKWKAFIVYRNIQIQ